MKNGTPEDRPAEKKTSGDTCNGRDASDELAHAIASCRARGGLTPGGGDCGRPDAPADRDLPVADARAAAAGPRPAEPDRHARRHVAAERPADRAAGGADGADGGRDTDQPAVDD